MILLLRLFKNGFRFSFITNLFLLFVDFSHSNNVFLLRFHEVILNVNLVFIQSAIAFGSEHLSMFSSVNDFITRLQPFGPSFSAPVFSVFRRIRGIGCVSSRINVNVELYVRLAVVLSMWKWRRLAWGDPFASLPILDKTIYWLAWSGSGALLLQLFYANFPILRWLSKYY